ncbi:hypothetical protein PC128_g9222 [Phytophthora cactorum]|nr:hypothetical protein PC128_g9222 [Phytophthora cactorum]
MRVIEAAGYDNFLVEREDTEDDPERYIGHVSFLVTYYYPTESLRRIAADVEARLEHENTLESGTNLTATTKAVRAAQTTITRPATATRKDGRDQQTVASASADQQLDELLVELRRRRKRNRAGQYILQYEVQPAGRAREPSNPSAEDGEHDDEGQWISIQQYDELSRDVLKWFLPGGYWKTTALQQLMTMMEDLQAPTEHGESAGRVTQNELATITVTLQQLTAMVMAMQVPGARVVHTSQRDELPQQWPTDDGRRHDVEQRPVRHERQGRTRGKAHRRVAAATPPSDDSSSSDESSSDDTWDDGHPRRSGSPGDSGSSDSGDDDSGSSSSSSDPVIRAVAPTTHSMSEDVEYNEAADVNGGMEDGCVDTSRM